jgi:hypothetical protein
LCGDCIGNFIPMLVIEQWNREAVVLWSGHTIGDLFGVVRFVALSRMLSVSHVCLFFAFSSGVRSRAPVCLSV